MPEARQPLDEQLDRPAAGAEAPRADAPTDPHSSPGAAAPGDDGCAAAQSADTAQGEDSSGADSSSRQGSAPASGGPDADESALQGDVDELVAVAAQRDGYLALAQRTPAGFEYYRPRAALEAAAAAER